MPRKKHEVLDLDYNVLRSRDWVATDSSSGEFLVIPLKEKRDKIAAVSVENGVIRIFVEVDDDMRDRASLRGSSHLRGG